MVDHAPERATGAVNGPPPSGPEVERAVGVLLAQGADGLEDARRTLERVAAAENRSVIDVARDLLAEVQRSQDRSPARLALLYSELGQALAETSGTDLLRRVTDLTVERLEGATGASVTVYQRSRYESIVATDPAVLAADRLQYELEEGPCVAAARGDGAYLATDMANEERWATFASRTREEVGLEAAISFRLGLHPVEPHDVSACLNIYGQRPEPLLGAESVVLGTMLAAHTSTAFVASRYQDHVDHLERALDSNRNIGMAMGILMHQHRVTAESAFSLLRIASQHANRKLRDIATDVVDTGTLALPEAPRGT